MQWFNILPILVIGFVAAAELAVTLLVMRSERQRVQRHSTPRRKIFRPLLIQGGKPQAPPEQPEETQDSKIA